MTKKQSKPGRTSSRVAAGENARRKAAVALGADPVQPSAAPPSVPPQDPEPHEPLLRQSACHAAAAGIGRTILRAGLCSRIHGGAAGTRCPERCPHGGTYRSKGVPRSGGHRVSGSCPALQGHFRPRLSVLPGHRCPADPRKRHPEAAGASAQQSGQAAITLSAASGGM